MSYEKRIILTKENRHITHIKALDCDISIQRMKYMLKKYQQMFAKSISKSGFWDNTTVMAIVQLKRQLNTTKNEFIELMKMCGKIDNEIQYLIEFKILFDKHCILPLCLKNLIIDYC